MLELGAGSAYIDTENHTGTCIITSYKVVCFFLTSIPEAIKVMQLRSHNTHTHTHIAFFFFKGQMCQIRNWPFGLISLPSIVPMNLQRVLMNLYLNKALTQVCVMKGT